MKGKKFARYKKDVLLVCVFAFLLSTNAFAKTTADLYVEEHKKNIYRKKTESRSVQTEKEDPALAQEKALISSQLEIITGDEETRYIIVPGDTLTISYNDRNEVKTAVYQVSSEGTINMPLIGGFKVKGLNRKEAREKINALLGQYIRYPRTIIKVNEEGRFMIIGAAGPGVFDISPNLTMMEAILNAGYNSDAANLRSVVVMRGGVDNPVLTRLNLKKMLSKGDRADNIMVKPGDLIYVPTSFLFNFDKVKDKLLGYLLDYYTLGGIPPLNRSSDDDSWIGSNSTALIPNSFKCGIFSINPK